MKSQIGATSNQEEWNSTIKPLKTSAEKKLVYDHKEKKKLRPKHSASCIDSENITIKINSTKQLLKERK